MRESEKSSTFIWWVRKVSLYLEESKQKNMTQAKFKPGNHIFYRNLDGGNDPHVVLEVRHRGVSRGGWWVRIDDGRWVKSKNCQLQEEWRKENNQ